MLLLYKNSYIHIIMIYVNNNLTAIWYCVRVLLALIKQIVMFTKH